MAKELIISANVHEKKVAIIEDGVVTEFYVERRDENQGVVGNLYKGRVMKVLPGMQSAFVDIGLERDAFLYVSDFTEFMEEEEEIDFTEKAEEKAVAREEKAAAREEKATVREERAPTRPDDRPRRDDRQRRGVVTAAAARSAPERAREEDAAETPVRIDDAVEQLAEIADERLIPPPPSDEELEERALAERAEPGFADLQPVEEAHVERILDEPFEQLRSDEAEEAKREQEPAAASVEVEAAATPEEKPRRGRSRKKPVAAETKKAAARTPKKKGAKEAAETAPAETAPAETAKRKSSRSGGKKGSRKPSATTEGDATGQSGGTVAASNLERITDEDMAQDAGDLLKDAIIQEKIIEQVHTAEYRTGPVIREPEPEWRVGSFKSQIGGELGLQRVVDESGETESGAAAQTAPSPDGAGEADVTPFRHISDVIPPGLYDTAQMVGAGEVNDESASDAGDKASSRASEKRRGSSAAAGGDVVEGPGQESENEDLKAEVRDRGSRADLSQRRGGRGRRRGGPRRDSYDSRAPATTAPEEKTEEAAPAPEPEAQEAEEQPRQSATRQERRPDDRRPDPQRRPDQGRRPYERRPDPQRRPDQGRRGERSAPPTISELLHEGQEILVQIAKEPIAKKGARITSHMALPGRYLVYMPTVNHVGVSRKIPSEAERIRLKRIVSSLREREGGTGGFIARTACAGHSEQELQDDMRYLLRTWADVRKKAERVKSPALVHRDLDLVQRILRDQLSEDFSAIRVDNEVEYARIVEFINRVQPRLVKRVKLYTGDQPILEKYTVQPEIDKAVRPRVWLKSGGYIVINQTEALVAIDVNTGKFVGKSDKLEDTITRTNLEAAKEIVRQIRLRDLGGIIVVDFIDMEERKNRQRVMASLQQELQTDRAPSKILSIDDFGLVAITRKRVKQSLERTLCTPCPYCLGAGMVKSAQTMCFEILEQAKAMAKQVAGSSDVMLRVAPTVAEAFRTTEREVLEEIDAYFGTPVTIEADPNLHQEQYDFAIY
jgi:ribonuclease G